MRNLHGIFESTSEICLRRAKGSFISPQQELSLYWNSFLESELGKIYQAVPCDQLIKSLKLKEKRKGRASLFCGIFLGPEKLADFKVISRIRTELGNKLDLREVQAVLAKSWKPHLEQTNIVLEDTTCYESYMRPIVRGEEIKKVEFGGKVNMIQVDGINFIEHLSFDAFNEGPRLIDSIW